MLLSNYQKTEILIGTIMFPYLYYYYLRVTHSPIIIWDILWCTFTLFIILSDCKERVMSYIFYRIRIYWSCLKLYLFYCLLL